MLRLLSLFLLVTSIKVFAGSQDLISIKPVVGCTEALGDQLGQGEALPKEFRLAKFAYITNALSHMTDRQDDIIVNEGKVQKIRIDGPKAFAILQAFHRNRVVGHPRDRNRVIYINAHLNYKDSRFTRDPRNPEQALQVHTFESVIDKKLAIYGLLVERPSPQGPKFDELIMRLVETRGDEVAYLDIPLIYQNYGSSISFDKNLETTDHGYTYNYNADLRLVGNGPRKNSGVQASLYGSVPRPNPEGSLKFSLFVVNK